MAKGLHVIGGRVVERSFNSKRNLFFMAKVLSNTKKKKPLEYFILVLGPSLGACSTFSIINILNIPF
jgi:hypothetical protein